MDQKEHEDQKENVAVVQEEGPSPSQGGLRPPEERERWHRMRPQEVLAKVSASLSGLTQAEAQKRLGQYGRNELERKKGRTAWKLLAGQFQDALVWILLVAAGLALVFGEFRDATIIMIIVLLNAAIGFIQEYKAEKILERMESLATDRAMVVRDGEKKEVDSRELVPGDIVVVDAGAKVPADAYILESYSCKVDGFIFSGESRAENREAKVMEAEHVPVSDVENMLFMGESVVTGEAKAVVVATGSKTELGRLAHLAVSVETEATPLQKKMQVLSRNVSFVSVGIGAAAIFAGQYFGLSWYENFLLALALAVSVVPEGLPAAISVALALGMKRLLKRNVLAKRLSAVETLGSVTVICTDKTGTITRNELTVTKVVTGKTAYEVSGEGYRPTGNFFAGGEVVNPRAIPNAELLFRIGTLCNDASLVQEKDGRYVIAGDPTEGAMLVAARKFNADPNFFSAGERKVTELPFASERMRMSVAYKNSGTYSYVKGSPDVLLELSTRRLDESGQVVDFTEEDKRKTKALYDEFSAQALRVLAFAYRDLEGVAETRYTEEMERELVWVGMMAMIDPPRAEVAGAVRECRGLGLRVVMITGDYAVTAEAIAKEAGLIGTDRPYRVISGRELNGLSDDEIYGTFREKDVVFARIAPEQKLRLADLLQRRGEVVAMTGDGVNDAPALKKADIGVAMGIMGTDVSKEASDMILLDDNFASIVNGVKEGRTVYRNLRKFTHYVFTSNVSELFAVLLGLLLHIPAPILAVQILAIDLGTDVFPSFALGVDPEEPETIRKADPRQERQIVTWAGVRRLLALGAIMAAGAIVAFLLSLWRHGWQWGETLAADSPMYLQAVTVTYMVLAVTQMANLLQSRSETLSFFRVGVFRNLYVWGAIAASMFILWCFLHVSFFQTYLYMRPIETLDWVLVFFFTGLVFFFEEWRKKRLARGA
jgi:Ca2+-transporting ATPase